MPDRVPLGIGLMLGFTILAPAMDIVAKLATAHVPSAEVALARFAVQASLLTPLLWLLGKSLGRLTMQRLAWHGARGFCIAMATVCFMTAIRDMPVADALAIAYVEPLVLTLLGWLVLNEAIGWRRIGACITGFFGALLVLRPSFAEVGYIAVLPLLTALFFAFYMLLTRHMSKTEDAITLQAMSGVFGSIIVGTLLIWGEGSGSQVWDPVPPSATALWLMAGVGVLATASHLCLTNALRHAPAATLAPIGYFEIAAATLIGFWVFGDFPDTLRWVGIGIIVASGLFVLWRERTVAAEHEIPKI